MDGSSKSFADGYDFFNSKKWDKAKESFTEVLSDRNFLLLDYALNFRGLSRYNNSDYEGALSDFDELKKRYPKSILAGDSLLNKARALVKLGRSDGALLSYKNYLEGATADKKFDVQIEMAEMLIDAKDCSEAIPQFKKMFFSSRGREDVAQILSLAKRSSRICEEDLGEWLAQPAQEYSLAEGYYASSNWDDVIRTLKPLIAKDRLPSDVDENEAIFRLARAHRWKNEYDEAIKLFKSLLETSFAKRSRLELIKVYLKQNRHDDAIEVVQDLKRGLPARSREYLQFESKIAYIYLDRGDYTNAIQEWSRLVNYLVGKDKLQAMWNLGWAYYKSGDYANALKQMKLLSARKSDFNDRAIYWQARIYQKLGDETSASRIYRQIIKSSVAGYYGELSKQSLFGNRMKVCRNDISDGFDKNNFASVWKPEMPAFSELRKASPALARMEFLLEIGLKDLAAKELSTVHSFPPNLSRYVLWRVCTLGLHSESIRIIAGYFGSVLKEFPSGNGFSHFVWENFYPRGYEGVVEIETKDSGLDQDIVYSIIRTESHYRPSVISEAGAIGLMQLMPSTARSLVRGDDDFRVEKLFEPEFNIKYGIRYLQKLNALFEGRAEAMAAAYNAGEEAAARWLKNFKGESFDEWIEEIPYKETNLYVKKVLTTYWILKKLNG